jgi:hypothetical protein
VIVARPWLAIFLAGAPLLLLASQAARLDTSVPGGDWLPPAAESVVKRFTRSNKWTGPALFTRCA